MKSCTVKSVRRPQGKLTPEDLAIREVILATGTLKLAAEVLGWSYTRLVKRLARNKQRAWWAHAKAERARERRNARQRRWYARRRERELSSSRVWF
jgi:hypothetical protein